MITLPLRRILPIALGAALMVTFASCIPTPPVESSSPPVESPSPSGVASSQPELDLAPDAPQTKEAAEQSAQRVLLRPSEVPGSTGKRGSRVTGRFSLAICGFDLEPHRPAAAFNARLMLEDGGQFIQSARPIGATRAREIVVGLRKTLTTCTSYTADTGEETDTYSVKPLTFANPDVVGFALRGDKEPFYGYYAFLTLNDCLVMFKTLGGVPDLPPDGIQLFDSLIAAAVKKATG